jgi:benzoyl-CoA reductase subunit C
LPFLTGELATFKTAVEEWTGRQITDDDLDRATDVYNENRRLLHAMYDLRKQDNPPLTGEEAMEMVIACQMTDKAEHNQELKRVLGALPGRTTDRATGVRLMIVGSEDDDTEFLRMVESCGATFVVDEHCTGTRYFWNEVEPRENRLEAIAARYIDRVPCPTKDWVERRRIPHILKLARKFCDPHELDTPAIRKVLEASGIKTLFLEFDVTVPVGQFKVRVEAFLEMLGDEDLFE